MLKRSLLSIWILFLLFVGCKKFVPGELALPSQPNLIKYCWQTFDLGIKDKNEMTRISTIQIVAKLTARKAAATIQGAEFDSKVHTMRAVAATLAKLYDSTAFLALVDYTDSPDFIVRESVVQGLVRMRKIYGETITLSALKKMDKFVDSIAVDTLLYQKEEIQLERQALRAKIAMAMTTLKNVKTGNVTKWRDAYNTQSVSGKGSLIYLAGEIKPPDAETWLGERLRDPSGYMRSKAAEALAKFESEKSRALLKTVLNDKDEETQIAAASALLQTDEAMAIRTLFTTLTSLDEDIRVRSLLTLGNAKSDSAKAKIIPLLRGLALDKSEWIQIGVIGAMGSLGDTASIPFIESKMKDVSPDVREISVSVLAKFRKDAMLPTLLELGKDDEYSMRAVAVTNLEHIKYPENIESKVIPFLYKTIKYDTEMLVRVRAAYLLMILLNDKPIEPINKGMN